MSERTTASQIEQRLKEALSAASVTVADESHLHRNHPEAIRSGGGHFRVEVVASCFEGRTRLECHQLVYSALEKEFSGIHALSIKTSVPTG